jgi:hypothetical protein
MVYFYIPDVFFSSNLMARGREIYLVTLPFSNLAFFMQCFKETVANRSSIFPHMIASAALRQIAEFHDEK